MLGTGDATCAAVAPGRVRRCPLLDRHVLVAKCKIPRIPNHDECPRRARGNSEAYRVRITARRAQYGFVEVDTCCIAPIETYRRVPAHEDERRRSLPARSQAVVCFRASGERLEADAEGVSFAELRTKLENARRVVEQRRPAVG